MTNNSTRDTEICITIESIMAKSFASEEDLHEIKRLCSSYDGNNRNVLEGFEMALTERFNYRKAEAKNFIKEARTTALLGTYPTDTKHFIRLALNYLQFSLASPGSYVCAKDAGQTKFYSDRDVRAQVISLGDLLQQRFGKSEFDAHWIVIAGDEHTKNEAQLQNNITYTKALPEVWEALAKALLESKNAANPDYVSTTVAVLQTWIWRVKNKLAHKEITDQVAPFLTGPQGSGKTSFVNWFLKPISDAVANSSIDLFSDNGRSNLLEDKAAIFLDEAKPKDKADYDRMKDIMTAHTYDVRGHYQQSRTIFVKSSFIACSNHRLREIIDDKTGTRRFWEIQVQPGVAKWNILKDINPLELWQSIDENDAAPLDQGVASALLTKLQKRQGNKLRAEEWIIDGQGIPFGKYVSHADLYKLYQFWESAAYKGSGCLSTFEFGRQLTSLANDYGIQSKKSSVSYWLIPDPNGGGAGDHMATAQPTASQRSSRSADVETKLIERS